MTLQAALRKAKLEGVSQIYQGSKPWHLRGIKTCFDDADQKAIDWLLYRPIAGKVEYAAPNAIRD